jgi:hypothetical protein
VVEEQVVGAISNIAEFLFTAGDAGVKLNEPRELNNVSSIFVWKCLQWIYLGPFSQNQTPRITFS